MKFRLAVPALLGCAVAFSLHAREIPVYREFSEPLHFSGADGQTERAVDAQGLQILRENAAIEHIGGAEPLFPISFSSGGSAKAGEAMPAAFIPRPSSEDRAAMQDRQWLVDSLRMPTLGQTASNIAGTAMGNAPTNAAQETDWLVHAVTMLTEERAVAANPNESAAEEMSTAADLANAPEISVSEKMGSPEEEFRKSTENTADAASAQAAAQMNMQTPREQALQATEDDFFAQPSEAMKTIAELSGIASSGIRTHWELQDPLASDVGENKPWGESQRLFAPTSAESPLLRSAASEVPERNLFSASDSPATFREVLPTAQDFPGYTPFASDNSMQMDSFNWKESSWQAQAFPSFEFAEPAPAPAVEPSRYAPNLAPDASGPLWR